MTVTASPQGATPEASAPVQGTQDAAVVPTTPEEKPLSPQFAALARQQKALRKAQMDIDAREAALKAKEAEYATNYIPKSRFKEDPYAVLTEEGIPFETLANRALQEPASPELKRLQQRIDELEGRAKSSEEGAKTAQQAAYNEAVEHIRVEATELVSKDASFEMIKANNAEEAVVALIEETFKKSKKLLTVAEAAQRVEEYLLEHALKIASLSKVKQKLSPPPAPEVPQPKIEAQSRPAQNVTMQPSNRVSSQPTQNQIKTITNAATVVPSKPLTEKQRVERAIAAFRGQQIA